MRIIKLASSYICLVKLQPCGLNNMHSSKTKLWNFSVRCFSNIVKESDTVLFSGVEQLKGMSPISKKNNQLSQVEEKDTEYMEKLKKGVIYYPFKSPEDRVKHVLAEDVKITFNKIVKALTFLEIGKTEHKIFERQSDILIIGGGAVGLSIAFTIKSNFPYGPSVTVVDKDSSCPHASTNLSQGIISQQLFTDEEEISMLKYGAEFFSKFTRNTEIEGKREFNLPYDPLGTLILADSSNAAELLKRNDKLKLNGIHNKILDCKTLKDKFPWLNTEGILFGSLGMINEGIIDPWSYLVGLKSKAFNLGVKFVTAEVIDFGCFDRDVRRVVCKLPDGTYNFIEFSHCVLAGGLETLNLVKILNDLDEMCIKVTLPLEERMRYEYCMYTSNGPGLNTPTLIDSEGTYFRRVGLSDHYVVGVPSLVNDEENDPYHIFHSRIKPFLMKRTPSLKKVDLIGGWVDMYEFCPANGVGITGPHPDSCRIVFALGFTHLGLQYLPALARAVMECIVYSEYKTIDFTSFHLQNLWIKQHIEAEKREKELLESKQRMALPN